MPALDQLFTTVETYENMNIQYLSVSSFFFFSSTIAAALLANHVHVPGFPRDRFYITQ